MFYDRPLHLGLLAGPDYSTALVSVTNPELVTRAEKTLAPHGDIHGYTTIKDIMDALNPLTGKIYLEALEWTRVGRIMCMLMFGKFPHPSTIVPGGMSTTVTTSTFNEYYTQLGKILDWCKVICRIWDDLCRLLPGGQPRLRAGRSPADEPHPDRHLGQLRGLRRHLRQLQPVGQRPLVESGGDHRGQAASPPT